MEVVGEEGRATGQCKCIRENDPQVVEISEASCPKHGGPDADLGPDGRRDCGYCEERLRVNVGLAKENEKLRKQLAGKWPKQEWETIIKLVDGSKVHTALSVEEVEVLYDAAMRPGWLRRPVSIRLVGEHGLAVLNPLHFVYIRPARQSPTPPGSKP